MTWLKPFRGHPLTIGHPQGHQVDTRQDHKARIGHDKDHLTTIGVVHPVVTRHTPMVIAHHPGKRVITPYVRVIHLVITKGGVLPEMVATLMLVIEITLHSTLPPLDMYRHITQMVVDIQIPWDIFRHHKDTLLDTQIQHTRDIKIHLPLGPIKIKKECPIKVFPHKEANRSVVHHSQFRKAMANINSKIELEAPRHMLEHLKPSQI